MDLFRKIVGQETQRVCALMNLLLAALIGLKLQIIAVQHICIDYFWRGPLDQVSRLGSQLEFVCILPVVSQDQLLHRLPAKDVNEVTVIVFDNRF